MGKVEILSSDRAKMFGDPTIPGITSEALANSIRDAGHRSAQ